MTELPTIPAKRMLVPLRASSGLIKGQGLREPTDGAVPAYSASGQDVWLPASQAPATRPGIVLSAVGAQCGKTFLADHPHWGTVANTASFGIAHGWCPEFVQQVLNQPDFWLKGGAAQPYVLVSASLAQPVWKASPSEQQAVVEFLRRETGSIDSFVQDQEQLVALMGELRRTQIVRGIVALDGAVNRKAARTSWVETIPADWESGNIRRFASMRTGHTPSRSMPEYWEEPNIPWFSLADVWQLREGRKYIDETSESFNELGLANSAAELLPAGTVVLSRTASIGFTGIMARPMATDQSFWNWVPKRNLMPEFLWYQLQAMRPYFESLGQGSTFKTIYQGDAAAMRIVVPPLTEQQSIVARLDQLLLEIDAAIADARKAIALSRERRAALVAAAVKGDLRVAERKRVLV